MNELIFIIQSLAIAGVCLGALRLGKEALVATIALFGVLSNLFVVKQITLFGLHATAADAFSVGMLLGLNLLQEYFGKKIAKQAIWISFFCLLLYTGASQLHLAYTPSILDLRHIHFASIMRFAPRITMASLAVYLFVQHLDRYLYGKLQIRFGKNFLLIRNVGLIAIIQLLDTALFSLLGLYGVMENLVQITVVSYGVKLLALIIATPFISLSKKLRQTV